MNNMASTSSVTCRKDFRCEPSPSTSRWSGSERRRRMKSRMTPWVAGNPTTFGKRNSSARPRQFSNLPLLHDPEEVEGRHERIAQIDVRVRDSRWNVGIGGEMPDFRNGAKV